MPSDVGQHLGVRVNRFADGHRGKQPPGRHRRPVEIPKLASCRRPVGWGGGEPTPITPPGETWGELTFRRLRKGKWILGGFLSSRYSLAYRVVSSPVANMHTTPIQTPVVGTGWTDEDHANNRVAQLYGGYVLPNSRFDVVGGFGLMVSQWRTETGWPYRAMQFKASVKDSTIRRRPTDPIDM